MKENKVIIYTANDGKTKVDVKLEEETLWLTQTLNLSISIREGKENNNDFLSNGE